MASAEPLTKYLDQEGKLKIYPSKKKYRIIALTYLSSKFEKGKIYSEKQVNEILDRWHVFNDRCLLRRELFDYRFLNRRSDCSEYWLEEKQPSISAADLAESDCHKNSSVNSRHDTPAI